MFADYRNVLAIITGVGVLQVAGGLLSMLTPLGLEAIGLSPLVIGLIAALHAAGFMAGAASAPKAVTTFGNIRVFSAAAALTGVGALLMQLYPNAVSWTLIRILQGACFAWMFASAESWLSEATPMKSRGAVLGFYHVIAKIALLVGPFLAVGDSPLDPRGFMWCALFLTLSLAPICLTRRGEPPPPDAAPLPLSRLYEIAPAAVMGVFMAGVINTGTIALMPVYAAEISPEGRTATDTAAIVLAFAWLGGLISQWPAGRISDRIDRRLVVGIMTLISGAAAIALGLIGDAAGFPVALGLLAIWGAGSLSFYGIAVAHAIDRSTPTQIPRVMSGLLFVWALGSVIGPPLSGFAFGATESGGGLFLLAGVYSFALTASMIWRKSARAAPKDEVQEPWSNAQPTSVAAAKIDPRGESEPLNES